MNKLLIALSLTSACAFASNAATWFSGLVSSGAASATNGAWSGTGVDGVELATDHFVLDTDANQYLTFTPDQSKTPDSNSVDTVVIEVAFTPSAYASLTTPPVDAQTAFVAAYTSATPPVTNYYAYIGSAWVALSGATPALPETIVTLTIDVDYSGANPKARFDVGGSTLTGTGAVDGWFTLSGAQKTITSIACSGCGKVKSIDGSIVVKTAEIVVDGGTSIPDAASTPAFESFLEAAGYSNMSASELTAALNANVAETGVKAWQCYALGLGNPASLTSSAINEKLAVTAASADTATDSLKIAVPQVTAGAGYVLKYQRMKKVGSGEWAADGEAVSAAGLSSLTIPLDGFENGTRYRIDVVISAAE